MRFQERIYIQNNPDCLRNKDILNVNCSSDMEIWSAPTFNITGTTSNTCVTETIMFTGVSYDTILSAATAACPISASCLDNIIWYIEVVEDSNIAYSGSFWTGTSLTADTPTDNQLIYGLSTAFATLDYSYSNSGTTFYVSRPYGVDLLTFNICLDINYSLPCTGSCSMYCTTIATQAYSSITSASTGVYIVDSATTINLGFEFDSISAFTGNTNATFKYEIYKYNDTIGLFGKPPVYKNGSFTSDDFITLPSTYLVEQEIPISGLSLDGDYLVKVYFNFDVTTDYRNRLGDTIDTLLFTNSRAIATYDRTVDGYFTANYAASTPYFSGLGDIINLGTLVVRSELVTTPATDYKIGTKISSKLIVALNGLTLAKDLDYSYSASVIESGFSYTWISLFAPTVSGDILTYAYITNSSGGDFTVDTLTPTVIVSGATDGQGTNTVYYNTTTNKYEIFTSITPAPSSNVYVTLNGVTLANGLDYYQSISNPKRIILIGTILSGDIINIYYNGMATVNDNVFGANKTIFWYIPRPPQKNNGYFTLEVSTGNTFSAITQSATTDYIANVISYSASIVFSGEVNTELYYRVKNTKEYETMCGDLIISEAYSEIIPITIRTNAINSY